MQFLFDDIVSAYNPLLYDLLSKKGYSITTYESTNNLHVINEAILQERTLVTYDESYIFTLFIEKIDMPNGIIIVHDPEIEDEERRIVVRTDKRISEKLVCALSTIAEEAQHNAHYLENTVFLITQPDELVTAKIVPTKYDTTQSTITYLVRLEDSL